MAWANTANAGFNAGTSECRSTRGQQSNPLQPGNALGVPLAGPHIKDVSVTPCHSGVGGEGSDSAQMTNTGSPEKANVNSDVICYTAISRRVALVLCASV